MIPATINIKAVEQVGDYALRLSFDDGTAQTVDFKPFLSLSRHPDIRAYLEPGARARGHELGVKSCLLPSLHRTLGKTASSAA